MKQFGCTATLLAALVLGPVTVSGCASTNSQSDQAIKDATITTGVKAAIVGDPNLKVSELKVETDQGVVQLGGYVSSADDVAAAAAAARTVKGVKSVRNDLRLR
ncbi:BON domain-containing protein [Massilia norwichensis]|uniref:BON domain-containing protein n=1 Tax=Massilia norwichensis TaxID=1442366 RepID=A0ABT2A7C2_9BURK|nr:BON domain-containing protein [Massilia norwichensis]MCS0590072.1 BON domain-containing protein [Massilia norwichensis]